MLWLWSWPDTHGIFGVGVAVGSSFSLGAGLLLGAGFSLGLGFAHTAYRVVSLLIFYAFSAMIACGRSILVGAPSLKIVVSSGGFLTIYCKGSFFATFYRLCLRLL